MAEAELATVARPYARAAFATALDEADGLVSWSKMLALLSAAVVEPAVERMLDNPANSGSVAAEWLTGLIGDELTASGANFIKVLADYDRLALIATIAEQYEVLKANHEKTVEVAIVSAYELSGTEQETLKDALNRRLQRTVELETETDSSLLGGVVIRTEDTVIDDSVRGKLQKLAGTLQ
ncbi:MAG: F0F1 ATP synthase subunit delta [Gammaproteobacteria bacterium]|jgi:F-type H+-transporting ATPase subunit delta|nr:F0F1 ATP synthase subunit delta [Gammaproteobacteria bacterium]